MLYAQANKMYYCSNTYRDCTKMCYVRFNGLDNGLMTLYSMTWVNVGGKDLEGKLI